MMRERRIRRVSADQVYMKFKKTLCALLCALTVAATGCGAHSPSNNSLAALPEDPKPTEPVYEEITANPGESASFGNMTMTVDSFEDPQITMESTGLKAVFFQVTIENKSEETVVTNYLNNFTLTVDGTYQEANECFTIPVMQKFYNFKGEEPFKAEIAPGESFTGYLAAEVNPEFKEIQLHYTPKTTDRGSRITVTLTDADLSLATK